jgi:hypothetical protein
LALSLVSFLSQRPSRVWRFSAIALLDTSTLN